MRYWNVILALTACLIMCSCSVVSPAFASSSSVSGSGAADVDFNPPIIIIDPTEKGGSEAVKNALDYANGTISGTSGKDSATFYVDPNDNGVQGYPSVYLVMDGSTGDDMVAEKNTKFTVDFDVPAGVRFGIRFNGVSNDSITSVTVSGYSGSVSYTFRNVFSSAPLYVGSTDGSSLTTSTSDNNVIWMESGTNGVTVHMEGKRGSSYLHAQIFMDVTVTKQTEV